MPKRSCLAALSQGAIFMRERGAAPRPFRARTRVARRVPGSRSPAGGRCAHVLAPGSTPLARALAPRAQPRASHAPPRSASRPPLPPLHVRLSASAAVAPSAALRPPSACDRPRALCCRQTPPCCALRPSHVASGAGEEARRLQEISGPSRQSHPPAAPLSAANASARAFWQQLTPSLLPAVRR